MPVKVPMSRKQRMEVLDDSIDYIDKATSKAQLSITAIDMATSQFISFEQDTTSLDQAAEKVKQAKALLNEAHELVRRTALGEG